MHETPYNATSHVPCPILLSSHHAKAFPQSSSVQANNRVPPLHLHAVAHIQFVNEERMLDPRRSLLRELVHGVLQLVAQAFDHVACDEKAGSGS